MKATLLMLLFLGLGNRLNACESVLQVSREKGNLVFRIAGHVVQARSLSQRYSDFAKSEKEQATVTINASAGVTVGEVKLINRLLNSAGISSVTANFINNNSVVQNAN